MAYRTLAEEASLVDTVTATGRVAVDVIGSSVNGTPLRLWRVGAPPPTGRAVLLLTGAQHGNEGAGREALLDLIEDYANGSTSSTVETFLETHGLLVLPTCNPDGVAEDQRNNALGVDVNRQHLTLTQPEARAIAEVLRDTRPALGVDLHEGNVAEDAQLLPSTHPMVRPVSAQRGQSLIAGIGDYLGTVGRTTGVWSGSGDEQILRNMSGLRHTAGIVAECKSTGGEADRLAICRAVADGSVAYAASNAAAAIADADQAAQDAIAVGGAADEGLDLRVATVDPPPEAYQLSSADAQSTSQLRNLLGVSGSTTITLAQSAYGIIPLLVDRDAPYSVVTGTRVFPLTPTPSLPPVAVAVVAPGVHWLGVHRVTGEIICDLPDVTGSISRILSDYATSQLQIPIQSKGAASHVPYGQILEATDGKAGAIVAVINGIPTWMGLPVARRRGSSGSVRISAATPEAYFAKRKIRDHEFRGVDRAQVAERIAHDAESLDGEGQGLGFEYDVELTGDEIDRDYASTDRLGIYKGLQELAEGGLEWQVRLDWADASQTRLLKILHIAPRIGAADSARPKAVFETAITWDLTEDWSTERYANHVLPYGPGEGDDQPVGQAAIDTAAWIAGVPIVEYVWQPGQQVTDETVLTEHGIDRLAYMADGSRKLDLTAQLSAYPHLNVDIALGDTAQYALTGDSAPDTVTGTPRLIGFDATPTDDRWSPILIHDPREGS